MRPTFTALLALVVAPAFAETPVPGIDGVWASIACEVRPQQGPDGVAEWWVTREITFEDGRIAAEFTTYAGPGCEIPVQKLSFAGQVNVIGESNVAPNAKAANLVIDEYVGITPLAQPFADFLNSVPAGSCGATAWETGTEQMIHETGCTLLGVEPGKPTIEYEILHVAGDQLFFGARPVDGSFITSEEKRPKALLVPLERK